MSGVERSWLPVLLYHRVAPRPPTDPYGNFVSPQVFESHLRWLRAAGHRSVSMQSVARSLSGGPRLPNRAFAITFDDGYLDVHRHAFPLLQRYGFGATVFVVTDAIGGMSSFDAGSGYEPAPMLGRKEIREMRIGGIDFGSHTCSHPESLAALDGGRLKYELESSRLALEALLESRVDLFAYPHSRLDTRVEAAVAAAGYRLACAGVGTRFDPFCVSRVMPPQTGGPAVHVVAGWRRLKWRTRSVLSALPGRAA